MWYDKRWDRGAEMMTPPESADVERGGGCSAEFPVRARAGDGPMGKTHGTVCGLLPQGRYPFLALSLRGAGR